MSIRPFETTREADFRADYEAGTLTSVRLGLALGPILYAIFAPLDLRMLQSAWGLAYVIRFAIVIPIGVAALGLTYVQAAHRHLQWIAAMFVTLAGIGIVAMISAASPSDPAFEYYYAGLLLVLIFSVAVMRLRFVPALICSLSIITAYEIVAIWDQGLLNDGWLSGWGPIFINNNFFLIAAGIITLLGAYALEGYARNDFAQRAELAHTLNVLKATQAQLVQAERSAAMGSVVAGLLHELNNPIGAISSATDIVGRSTAKLRDALTRSERDQPVNRTLSMIEDNVTLLRTATNRVIEALGVLKRFSHLDRSKTSQYDVNRALADCVALLAHVMTDRITVVREFGDVPVIVCRPGEINQVLMNVLTNAVESMPATGTLTLRTGREREAVRVDITDTGKGMTREQLEQIFTPKFNRDASRVKLGMGMVTAQNIVERHHGTINIRSELGQGTTVTLTLPLAPPKPGSASHEA